MIPQPSRRGRWLTICCGQRFWGRSKWGRTRLGEVRKALETGPLEVVMKPYYQDELVTLYLGDCREVTEWLAADVLVTDPPYGRDWRQGGNLPRPDRRAKSAGHDGIAGDKDSAIRDAALQAWAGRPAIVFGDLMLPPPPSNKQTIIYHKPLDAGVRGATAGFRRDAEAVYLLGRWKSGIGGTTSVLATGARSLGNPYGCAARYGHPHAKPVDVMETLIGACPPGIVADPFAGSGSTLVAARNLGRKAIGVELEEPWCERAAERLSQQVLLPQARSLYGSEWVSRRRGRYLGVDEALDHDDESDRSPLAPPSP